LLQAIERKRGFPDVCCCKIFVRLVIYSWEYQCTTITAEDLAMTPEQIRELEALWRKCSELEKKAIVDEYVAIGKENFSLTGFHVFVQRKLCQLSAPTRHQGQPASPLKSGESPLSR
jgi:hypothetical protein